MKSFVLTKEPWIPCRLTDGSIVRLSLVAAFARSSEVVSLASEWRHVDVAVLKLLLAITRRALEGPRTLESWLALWRGGLPLGKIQSYLESWERRFDLLAEDRPFFQWPGTTVNNLVGLQRLVHSKACGSNTRLFDKSTDDEPWSTDLATAAELVVGWQSYALAGGVSKPFNLSKPPMLQGSGGGMAFTISGRTLAETIVLNTIADETAASWHDPSKDRAAWEVKNLPEPTSENFYAKPVGIADHDTWQSRRMLLTVAGERATRVAVVQGFAFPKKEEKKKANPADLVHCPYFASHADAEGNAWTVSSRDQAWEALDVLTGSGLAGSSSTDGLTQLRRAVAEAGLELPDGIAISAFGMQAEEPYAARILGTAWETLPLVPGIFGASSQVHAALEVARTADKRIRGKVFATSKDVLYQDRSADSGAVERFNSPDRVSARFWARIREPFLASLAGLASADKAALAGWTSVVEAAQKETYRSVTDRLGSRSRGLAAAVRGGLS